MASKEDDRVQEESIDELLGMQSPVAGTANCTQSELKSAKPSSKLGFLDDEDSEDGGIFATKTQDENTVAQCKAATSVPSIPSTAAKKSIFESDDDSDGLPFSNSRADIPCSAGTNFTEENDSKSIKTAPLEFISSDSEDFSIFSERPRMSAAMQPVQEPVDDQQERKEQRPQTEYSRATGPASTTKFTGNIPLARHVGEMALLCHQTTTKRSLNGVLVDRTFNIAVLHRPVLSEITESTFKNRLAVEIANLQIKNIRSDYPKIKAALCLCDDPIFTHDVLLRFPSSSLNRMIVEKAPLNTAEFIHSSVSNASDLSPLELNVLNASLGLPHTFNGMPLTPNLLEQVALLNNKDLVNAFIRAQTTPISYLIIFCKLGLARLADFRFLFALNRFNQFLVENAGLKQGADKKNKWNMQDIVDFGISKILNVETSSAAAHSPLEKLGEKPREIECNTAEHKKQSPSASPAAAAAECLAVQESPVNSTASAPPPATIDFSDVETEVKGDLYNKTYAKSFADIFTLEGQNKVAENIDISSYVSDVSEKDRPILQMDDSSAKGSVISNIFGFFKKKPEPKAVKDDFMLERMNRKLTTEMKAPEKERTVVQDTYANMKRESTEVEIPGFKGWKK